MHRNLSGQTAKVDLQRVGLFLVLAVVLGAFLIGLKTSLAHTAGHFTYGIDDAYIHLSIAKNFALHGIWGVTPFAPSSASSSPFWTLLLALVIKFTGNSIYGPVVLCLFFSTLTATFLYRQLVKRGFNVPLAVACSLLCYFGTALHMLIFLGMEQNLHVLLVIAFAFFLLDRFRDRSEREHFLPAVILTMAMCLTRFESVFLLVVPLVYFGFKRDWTMVTALILGPVIGLGGFALLSHSSGMPYIPNSILLKGNRPNHFDLAYILQIATRARVTLMGQYPTLTDLFAVAVVLGIVLLTKPFRKTTGPVQVLLWTTIVATSLHAGLALVGTMYRYEAYFVALLITCIALSTFAIVDSLKQIEGPQLSFDRWALGLALVIAVQYATFFAFMSLRFSVFRLILLALVLIAGWIAARSKDLSLVRFVRSYLGICFPVALVMFCTDRLVLTTLSVPNAAQDIYCQQTQMSRFVHQFYPTGRIVANDIGAISYFNDIHLLDFAGLASDSMAQLRLKGDFNTASEAREIATFNPDLIVIYPIWFRGSTALPPSAIPICKWVLPSHTSSASETVVFFTVGREKAKKLRHQLMAFSPSLPGIVHVQFYRFPWGY